MADINTREIILSILVEVLEKGSPSHVIVNGALDKYGYFPRQDRSFIKRICEGTIEYKMRIDHVIGLYSKTPVVKMKPEIRNILRLSVYQILFMDSVPDYSVCNEAVKLTVSTKKYRNLKGFVNGVLRTVCREKDSISYPDDSVYYSMPQWIIDQWTTQYGKEARDSMLKAQEEVPKTIIRPGYGVKLSDLKKELEEEGVKVCKAPYNMNALEISGLDNIGLNKGFLKGRFYIQDISSMLVGLVADPKEGDLCLDVCASPGGKSLHLASLMNNTGLVIARDKNENKVDLLKENFIRSGLSNLRAECFDATVYDESMRGKVDVLICDLPCSGLGVIRRKPDIKYNMTIELQQRLVDLQRKIISNVESYVKTNGKLIYSTCTTNVEENMNNIKWICDNYPYRLESINKVLPEDLRCETGEKGYIQLIPGINKCDGFFICKLLRIV
ncbi:MAG: 16S rRNA (cytosine(967)-C(5))-methyltransferase RsmB [Lachnospiraceae bacterium]|nr:16S rRNA (cytosine(967)-C(5))-methyltransferase RsmB [Lachnospiraceae bacterium]